MPKLQYEANPIPLNSFHVHWAIDEIGIHERLCEEKGETSAISVSTVLFRQLCEAAAMYFEIFPELEIPVDKRYL
jgi:hypothetical protein